ncbi:MAG: DMT family transporter [Candidatus Aenigmarchaeota archaeon]|nr:DMT family transporter [Candidatus Aenigmarchaeota archaeon]
MVEVLQAIPGVVFGLLAMLSWGISDFIAASLARRNSSMQTFFWTQLVSLGLFILTFLAFFSMPALAAETLGLIAIITVVRIAAFLAFYQGLRDGKIGVVSVLTNSWPAATVILALLFLGESLTAAQALAIMLVMAGATTVSFQVKGKGSVSLGARYGLFALAAFGIYFAAIGLLTKQINWFIPVLLIKLVQAPLLATYAKQTKKVLAFPRSAWRLVLVIGFLETVGFYSYGLGITNEYTAVIAPMMAGIPVITLLLARAFFRESLSKMQKIGIIAALAGLVLLSV